jgi:hypothetical protein
VGDRFRRRGGHDPWHEEVRRLVDEQGGDAVLAAHAQRLAAVTEKVPEVLVVESVEGDEDGTYEALVRALGDVPAGS